jgi:hypothetical protein
MYGWGCTCSAIGVVVRAGSEPGGGVEKGESGNASGEKSLPGGGLGWMDGVRGSGDNSSFRPLPPYLNTISVAGPYR